MISFIPSETNTRASLLTRHYLGTEDVFNGVCFSVGFSFAPFEPYEKDFVSQGNPKKKSAGLCHND